MNDSAIEAEKRGDLVLVERSAAAKRGKNESARGRAAGFALELFADGEVSGSDVIQDGISQNIFGNGFARES